MSTDSPPRDGGFSTRHRGGRERRQCGRASGCLAVVVALAVLVGVGVFVFVTGRSWLEDAFAPPADYAGTGEGSVLIEVEPGHTSTEIANTLKENNVIASVEAFMDEARTEDKAALIQAGYYEMSRRMSARSALDVLIDPANLVQNPVTIPEGYTVDQTLRTLAEETDIPLSRLRRAARHPRTLGLPDYAEGQLEGFLFPATYPLAPRARAREVLAMMVDRFEQAAGDLKLVQGAEDLDLTPLEVVTVASIVEAEVSRERDFPKVARVVYNRLERGMELQMDSTVHYAVGKDSEVTTTPSDRRSRSPYNTYRVTGLPPGPINSPGETALAAALHPAAGRWLYFVTVDLDTGRTRFAAGERGHHRNVQRFMEYCETSDAC
jgi:UPF0755 protein